MGMEDSFYARMHSINPRQISIIPFLHFISIQVLLMTILGSRIHSGMPPNVPQSLGVMLSRSFIMGVNGSIVKNLFSETLQTWMTSWRTKLNIYRMNHPSDDLPIVTKQQLDRPLQPLLPNTIAADATFVAVQRVFQLPFSLQSLFSEGESNSGLWFLEFVYFVSFSLTPSQLLLPLYLRYSGITPGSVLLSVVNPSNRGLIVFSISRPSPFVSNRLHKLPSAILLEVSAFSLERPFKLDQMDNEYLDVMEHSSLLSLEDPISRGDLYGMRGSINW